MSIQFEKIQTSIIYSKRKSISIELKANSILVRAPKGMSEQEIKVFLNEKQKWIEKHLEKLQEREKTIEKLPVFTVNEIKELADKALDVIPEKVRKYADIIGVSYGRITIRNQRTKWASCSNKGNLNFNCLLMLLPDEVIDYIVVHELCHRKYMNHSADFYAEVESVLPEYRRCQKWLKENGGLYMSRLP